MHDIPGFAAESSGFGTQPALPPPLRDQLFAEVLLELIAYRRVVVLIGRTGAEWPPLLDQVGQHIGAGGCLALAATARPGATLADLLAEALGAPPPARDADPDPSVLDRIGQELDRHSFGVLLVRDAHELGPVTLRDLVALAAEGKPGQALQVIMAGGPGLAARIERAGLADTVAQIGRTLELPADSAASPPGTGAAHRLSGTLAGIAAQARERLAALPRPGWQAAALAAAYGLGFVLVTALFSSGPAPDRVAPTAAAPPAAAPTITVHEIEPPPLSGTVPASFTPVEEQADRIIPPRPPTPPRKLIKSRAETSRTKSDARHRHHPAATACDDSYRRRNQVESLGEFGRAFATDLKSFGRCLGSLISG